MSSTAFTSFATALVGANDEDLCEYGPDEQISRAVDALEKFASFTHIKPATSGHMIDLAGFGSAPVHFENEDNRYLLLSEVATALGMPVWEACTWAEKQHLYAIQVQREHDEERGDGKLGWECLDDYCDLRFWFIADNPDAKPDAGGSRHSDYGDWLISHDRLLSFIAESPWGSELMTNMSDLFAHGAKKFFGDLKDIPAFRVEDGVVTEATGEDLFHTDLTEEEARRKARRGPHLDIEGGA